jgi:radical SAM superfamily enzyme YgiQ (UPF0313 family)
VKLHLIIPKWPDDSLWGQIYFRFPYLSVTTLAGLTGNEWEISIIDENVEPLDMTNLPDLAAISIMTPLAPQGYDIADRLRTRGVPVVIGGIHASTMAEEAKRHADAIVVGEAEVTWPRVLADFSDGALKSFYEPSGFHPLQKLTIPRRDLLRRKKYFFANTIQTTRGCPFDCDFCSVTSFYGRTYRVRPVEEVINEIEKMERGFLFFVDDNIVGKPAYAKELFTALIPMKIKWFSQASLSIIKDRQLLALARDSGCMGLFIGFESLSQENLMAMGKSMNRAADYRNAITAIHDHGIGIQGSFIFGTDHDDRSVFSDVLRFVEKTRLEAALFSILTPYPGTGIYETMVRDDRIIDTNWAHYDMNHVVFRPKHMSPEELQEGFFWAYRRLYGLPSIVKRLLPPNNKTLFYGIQNYGFRQAWKTTLRRQYEETA